MGDAGTDGSASGSGGMSYLSVADGDDFAYRPPTASLTEQLLVGTAPSSDSPRGRGSRTEPSDQGTYAPPPGFSTVTGEATSVVRSNPAQSQVGLLNSAPAVRRSSGESVARSSSALSEISKGKGNSKSQALFLSFVAMVLVGLGNKLFSIFETRPMYNYPFFLSLLSTFVYVPLSFLYILPMQAWGSAITPEQMRIPKSKFAVMGVLDAFAGLMQMFATNFITQRPTIILLQQTAIPISMLISKWLLGAKYKMSQYIGAAVVLGGLVVVLMPEFLSTGGAGSGSSSSGDAGMQLVWAAVMALSCVPMCLSSVYKEKALGEVEIDVVYLNGWVAVFQLLVTGALVVPAAYASSLTAADVPSNLLGGMRCYLGMDSNEIINGTTYITSLHGGPEQCLPYPATSPRCDDCASAPLLVTAYLCFNVGYNILIILILKFGSSNILWLAMTLMVPMTNATFYIPGVPGHKNPDWEDIVGLAVIMFGLCTYRFAAKLAKKCRPGRGRRVSFVMDDEDEQSAAASVLRHLGPNQIDVLQPVLQSAVNRYAIPDLTKSPEQLRFGYLRRIGVLGGSSSSRRGGGSGRNKTRRPSWYLQQNASTFGDVAPSRGPRRLSHTQAWNATPL